MASRLHRRPDRQSTRARDRIGPLSPNTHPAAQPVGVAKNLALDRREHAKLRRDVGQLLRDPGGDHQPIGVPAPRRRLRLEDNARVSRGSPHRPERHPGIEPPVLAQKQPFDVRRDAGRQAFEQGPRKLRATQAQPRQARAHACEPGRRPRRDRAGTVDLYPRARRQRRPKVARREQQVEVGFRSTVQRRLENRRQHPRRDARRHRRRGRIAQRDRAAGVGQRKGGAQPERAATCHDHLCATRHASNELSGRGKSSGTLSRGSGDLVAVHRTMWSPLMAAREFSRP